MPLDSDVLDHGSARLDCRVPFQGSGTSFVGEHYFFQRKRPFQQLNTERLTVNFNGAKTGSGGEKSLERANCNLRTKPQCPLHGGVTKPGQCPQQGITGHGASVIIAAFVLVPGIATPAVVAAAQGLNNGQALCNETFGDEVRRDLVFDSSPNFVGVNKRQRGFATSRPAAQQQPWLVPHSVAGALRIGMKAKVLLKIVVEDGLQCRTPLFAS